jgi:hypothetical protein
MTEYRSAIPVPRRPVGANALFGRMIRNSALVSGAICVVLILAFLSPLISLARILLVAMAVVGAGHAALLLALGTASSDAFGPDRPSRLGYLAIAFGATVVLMATAALRVLHLYGYWSVLACLAALVAIVWVNPTTRSRTIGELKSARNLIVCYAACVTLIIILVAPENYPLLNSSAGYLTQGFDLLSPKNPSDWPYFGEVFRLPLLYVTHAIGALFALFSHGDEASYYFRGQYWLNIFLSPLVPFGAFLFFRRLLPPWIAVIVGLGFCWWVLGAKLISIRGETLGWIAGFAFLIGFHELLRRVGKGATRSNLRLTAVVAALYFTTGLTHGVVATLVTFMATGLAICELVTRGVRVALPAFLRTGVFFAACIGLLFIAYLATFSTSLKISELLFNYDRMPAAGELDSAMLIENALDYPIPHEVPEVHAAPPYIPVASAVQLTAFFPLARIFRKPSPRVLQLSRFPDGPLALLAQAPPIERISYMLVLLGAGVFYVCKRGRQGIGATVFWTSTISLSLIVAFTVYMDLASVSLFPLAAIRRFYIYVSAFYLLAVGIAALDCLLLAGIQLVVAHRLKPIVHRWTPMAHHWRQRVGPYAFVLPLAVLLLSQIFPYMKGSFSPSWIFQSLVGGIASRAAALPPPLSSPQAPTQTSSEDLIQAVRYIRAHTASNEWVFSNIISDNQFWYLSAGRQSVTEGSVMYQVYDLQRRAAARMREFARFSETSRSTIVDSYAIHYILLYKYCACTTSGCYGFNVLPTKVGAFEDNSGYSKVFENREFVIFSRRPDAAPEAPAPADSNEIPADCFTDGPAYTATLGEGIQFSRAGMPQFITRVDGLFDAEPGGRWSSGSEVVFHFRKRLPDKFRLKVEAVPFGPNAGKPVLVTVGSTSVPLLFEGPNWRAESVFDVNRGANAISFRIAEPIRPRQFDSTRYNDNRLIGLMFSTLRIDALPTGDAK